jgi:hypothetical protein
MEANVTTTTDAPADRADLIISHVVDGEATAQEWNELEALAVHEPRLWRELAQAQRDAMSLRGAMGAACAVAERVSLAADDRASESHAMSGAVAGSSHLRLNRLGAWIGWAVAAAVLIIASIQINNQRGGAGLSPTDNIRQAGLSNPIESAADAWNLYMDKGREDGSVLGEMPGRMLVESRPAPEGKGFEVIYIRQVMERAVVPDLYQVSGLDERGQPTLAPVRPAVQRTM